MPVAHAAVSKHRVKRGAGGNRAAAMPSHVGSASPRASFGTYFLAAAIITAALTFYVFLRVSSLHLGYVLTQARQDQMRLVLENRALKTETGTLSTPSRIRRLAGEKLGMVPGEKLVNLGEGAE
jgi:cell division protein FtsL